jgi:hypothetical protein
LAILAQEEPAETLEERHLQHFRLAAQALQGDSLRADGKQQELDRQVGELLPQGLRQTETQGAEFRL